MPPEADRKRSLRQNISPLGLLTRGKETVSLMNVSQNTWWPKTTLDRVPQARDLQQFRWKTHKCARAPFNVAKPHRVQAE